MEICHTLIQPHPSHAESAQFSIRLHLGAGSAAQNALPPGVVRGHPHHRILTAQMRTIHSYYKSFMPWDQPSAYTLRFHVVSGGAVQVTGILTNTAVDFYIIFFLQRKRHCGYRVSKTYQKCEYNLRFVVIISFLPDFIRRREKVCV